MAMLQTTIPEVYKTKLNLYDTQNAIALIKATFQEALSGVLNLKRVSAPLFVYPDTGLNDNLNGVERPVRFDAPATGRDAEVVHSLAKWKRYALKRYDFHEGRGLYTDMNAIRRDERLDNLHSIYVDQWDWEKVITRQDRNRAYLECTVRSIVEAVGYTLAVVQAKYPVLNAQMKREVTIETSHELLDKITEKPAKERSYLYTKELEFLFAMDHGTIFVEKIGGELSNGEPHDGRAPDYDDWELNGDIILYNSVLDSEFEISSMGIRVDEKSMKKQLAAAHCEERAKLPFHKALLNGELPLTIGGGIGQSRLCMFMLEKAHIGEVQSSIWDKHTMEEAEKAGVILL